MTQKTKNKRDIKEENWGMSTSTTSVEEIIDFTQGGRRKQIICLFYAIKTTHQFTHLEINK